MVCSTFNAVYSSRKFVIFSERLGYWKSYVIPSNLTLLLINVILLSLVQFLIFGHLLRSRIFLTNRKLVLCACTCLTLSIGYGSGIEYFIWTSRLKNWTYIYIIDDVALLIFVFIVIWFLIKRIRTGRKSKAAKNLKTRMTWIVFAILCLNSINALFHILKKASGFEISELYYIVTCNYIT